MVTPQPASDTASQRGDLRLVRTSDLLPTTPSVPVARFPAPDAAEAVALVATNVLGAYVWANTTSVGWALAAHTFLVAAAVFGAAVHRTLATRGDR